MSLADREIARTVVPKTKVGSYRSFVPKHLRNLIRHLTVAYRNRGFKPYWVTIETCGPPVRFLIANKEGEEWHLPYVTQPNREMTFVRDRAVVEGSRIVEVGTHHGFCASLLAKWIGQSGEIFCYEPVDDNCRIAKANFEANGFENVHIKQAAVGERAGMTFIAKAGSNPSVQSDGLLGTRCPIVRLDDEITGKVDLLKIDVEGYELHVLRGAQRILGSKPNLQIEVHPGPIEEFGGRFEQIFDLVPSDAYDFWLQRDTISEPEPYEPRAPIHYNSHLFGIRK